MPPTTFGITEFQLVLLRRMADYNPELVEQARTRLGASSTDMRETNAHWQRMNRSPTFRLTAQALRGFLGDPIGGTDQVAGKAGMRFQVTRWKLPLWPDLRLEAIAGADGAVLDYGLSRDPGSPVPELRRLADLEPWTCVIGDVAAAFAPTRLREGSAPSRRELLFDASNEGGEPVFARAEFVYGLLQKAGRFDVM